MLNDSRQLLIDFCQLKDLITGDSLLNVRANIRADINNDHQSCISKTEIKLKSTAMRNLAPINKLNIERLKSFETSNKFTDELKSNLAAT